MVISRWVRCPEARHAVMRFIKGTNPMKPENRVAFIEKTARVRATFIPYRDFLDDSKNWEFGYRGNDDYGDNMACRRWCDIKLIELYPNATMER